MNHRFKQFMFDVDWSSEIVSVLERGGSLLQQCSA